jgi:hypothetical protein
LQQSRAVSKDVHPMTWHGLPSFIVGILHHFCTASFLGVL